MRTSRTLRYLLLAAVLLALPASMFAGVFVSVAIAPPTLPVYVQPACPGDGYIWTPGYWAYGPDGYYWVPGTWVMAPEPGLLWTPGYWGWGEGVYVWHPGYWGPHVGFYGGINYGFGYFGVGYGGGYWSGRTFYYNRSVNNIRITNVHIYNKTVINNVTVNRVSYNGGHGGLNARPSHFEETAFRERHFQPTHMQMEHENSARGRRELWASENHGHPTIAATSRPGEFRGRGTESLRPERGHDPFAENHGAPRPGNNGRNDRPMYRQESSGNDRRNDRPAYHQESHGNRGEQPMRNNRQPEMRPQHESAPRGNGNAPHDNSHQNSGGHRSGGERQAGGSGHEHGHGQH
jgi:hypothetical protein